MPLQKQAFTVRLARTGDYHAGTMVTVYEETPEAWIGRRVTLGNTDLPRPLETFRKAEWSRGWTPAAG